MPDLPSSVPSNAKSVQVNQDQDHKLALAFLRPMLFRPKEDAFSGITVRTAYAMAFDDDLVGGDFWDTFAFEYGRVALVLGDVMGHGLTSAVFTAELKYTMRAYIREHKQPSLILHRMNEYLCESSRLFTEGINTEGSDAPVCIAIAIIERTTGAGTLGIAGMEPPILMRKDGRSEQSTAVGPPLGVFEGEEYEQVDFHLEAGDTLVMNTDGVTEARQEKQFLGTEGLMRLAVEGGGGSLRDMTDTIMSGAREFAGGKLRDDATVVVVRRTATAPTFDDRAMGS